MEIAIAHRISRALVPENGFQASDRPEGWPKMAKGQGQMKTDLINHLRTLLQCSAYHQTFRVTY